MSWKKGNQLFEWNQFPGLSGYSHASVPFALSQGNGEFLVYFGVRDQKGHSLPFCIKVTIENDSFSIVGDPIGPLMGLGNQGTFDDTGVLPTCIVKHNEEFWMYYIGWTPQSTVPYQLSIGLAISQDGIHFERYSNGPIMTKSQEEPYFLTAPFVSKDGDDWEMHYVSCTAWHALNGRTEPQYSIKRAKSVDGINWEIENKILLEYDNMSEAFGRPSLLRLPDGEKLLFFCYRKLNGYRNEASSGYRTAYAVWDESEQSWMKNYNDVMPLGLPGQWDEVMACYAHVFEYSGKYWMLYNGNDFGKSGFGYAQWIVK